MPPAPSRTNTRHAAVAASAPSLPLRLPPPFSLPVLGLLDLQPGQRPAFSVGRGLVLPDHPFVAALEHQGPGLEPVRRETAGRQDQPLLVSVGGVAGSSAGRPRSHSNRERSWRSKTAISPSSSSVGTSRVPTAAASSGNRRVSSRPCRLTRRTSLASS